MDYTHQGKPILPTKVAEYELSRINLDLFHVCEILERGFVIRKRSDSIIERGIRRGEKIVNVVVVDVGPYYKLIHAGEFSVSGKFKQLMRNGNGTQ